MGAAVPSAIQVPVLVALKGRLAACNAPGFHDLGPVGCFESGANPGFHSLRRMTATRIFVKSTHGSTPSSRRSYQKRPVKAKAFDAISRDEWRRSPLSFLRLLRSFAGDISESLRTLDLPIVLHHPIVPLPCS